MPDLSDDDVPTMASADDLRRGIALDGDTTAAAIEPPADADDEEDRTVQQKVGPSVHTPAAPADADHGTEVSARPPVTPHTPKSPLTEPPKTKASEPVLRARSRVAPPPSSRKMTAVGLGAPPPATRPAAGFDPPSPSSPPPTTDVAKIEDEEDDDSITATAPVPKISVPKLPISAPGLVEIRTAPIEDNEEGDETEVRTMPGGLPEGPHTKPAAGVAPMSAPVSSAIATARNPIEAPRSSNDVLEPADEPDDSVTTQAPAPNVPAGTPPIDSPDVIRISAKSLMPPDGAVSSGERVPSTSPHTADPPTAPGQAKPADEYFDEDEESITTRGPNVGQYKELDAGADYVDDSVTAQAPLTRAPGEQALNLPPPIEDGTEGTTQKIKKNKTAATKISPLAPNASADVSPADDEGESITAQAPGQVSNMLRVIAASPSSPDLAHDEEDQDDPHNRTAVMANAPIKPPTTPRTGGPRTAAAPRLEPTSESGLRVARESRPGSGERASLGALVAEPRPSGIAKAGEGRTQRDTGDRKRDAVAFAQTEQAFPPLGAPALPMLHEVEAKKPPYGLIVGIVAAFSVGIPLILFLALNQSGETEPRVAAQPSPDLIQRGDQARAKAPKGFKPPPDPTTSASASGSAVKPPPVPTINKRR